MCGIVGVISKTPSASTVKVMKDMLFFDTLRGEDSTGLIRVNSAGNVETYKRALAAPDFMLTKPAHRMLGALDTRVMIGHNRAATIGAINDMNAHPFSHGTVHGVHNGTLRSRYNLDEHAKFTVDSDNLYYHLSINGAVDTLKKVDGAFTLVWYDEADKTVHFVRNDERPLYFAGSEDNNHMFFASEAWMFKVAAARHKIELGATQELKPGVELVIDTTKFPAADCIETHVRELRPKYVAPAYQSANGGWQNNSANSYGSSGSYRSAGSSRAASNSDIDSPMHYKEGEPIRFKPTVFTRVWSQAENSMTQFVEGRTLSGAKVQAIISNDTYDYLRKNLELISTIEAGYMYTLLTKKVMNQSNAVYVMDARKKIKLTGINEVATQVMSDTDLVAKDFQGVYLVRKGAVVTLEYEGYNGKKLTLQQYTSAVRCGCASCNAAVTPKDHKDLLWYSDLGFLCPDCAEQETSANLSRH